MMLEAMSDECEIWTRGTTGNGYPAMKKGARTVYVKRALWEALHGSVPEGLTVRSRCGNRLCVNPEHLYLDRQGRLKAPMVNGRFVSNAGDSTESLDG